MIEVASFFEIDGRLVPVNDATAHIEDVEYIRGVVMCRVNGKELLTKEMIDLVDQLWAYLTDGLERVSNGESFSCYFPDQPIKVLMEPLPNAMLRVSVQSRGSSEAVVRKDEFVAAMAQAGQSFFDALVGLAPGERVTYTPYMQTLRGLAE